MWQNIQSDEKSTFRSCSIWSAATIVEKVEVLSIDTSDSELKCERNSNSDGCVSSSCDGDYNCDLSSCK